MITQEDVNKYLGKYFTGRRNEFEIPEENIKLSIYIRPVKVSRRRIRKQQPKQQPDANNYPAVLEYLDRSDRNVKEDALWKIFNEILGEMSWGRDIQGGAWKFPLMTTGDLSIVKSVLDKYLHAKNFKEADVKDSE